MHGVVHDCAAKGAVIVSVTCDSSIYRIVQFFVRDSYMHIHSNMPRTGPETLIGVLKPVSVLKGKDARLALNTQLPDQREGQLVEPGAHPNARLDLPLGLNLGVLEEVLIEVAARGDSCIRRTVRLRRLIFWGVSGLTWQ